MAALTAPEGALAGTADSTVGDKYASTFDAAARVDASTKTIRRWIASGHLAGYV